MNYHIRESLLTAIVRTRHPLSRAATRLFKSSSSLTFKSTVAARPRCALSLPSAPPFAQRRFAVPSSLQTRWNSSSSSPTPLDQEKTEDSQVDRPDSVRPEEDLANSRRSEAHSPERAGRERGPARAEYESETPEEGKRARRHQMLNKSLKRKETVYVGNLFFDMTADDLRTAMEKFGVVEMASIIHDNRGLSKGFGYVRFSTIEEAEKAIEQQHMQVLEGRTSVVQFANTAMSRSEIDKTAPTFTLFIGNVPYEMTDQDVNALFEDIHNIVDVRIPVDRRSGMPRGFMHVEFLDVPSAVRAKEMLSLRDPYGRKLRLNYAAPMKMQQRRSIPEEPEM